MKSIRKPTVPIFIPLAASLGFEPVWFALIMLLALEISFTTPPFGLLLFVMKGVARPDTTMRDIYLAAIPFIVCSLLLVGLLILTPRWRSGCLESVDWALPLRRSGARPSTGSAVTTAGDWMSANPSQDLSLVRLGPAHL